LLAKKGGKINQKGRRKRDPKERGFLPHGVGGVSFLRTALEEKRTSLPREDSSKNKILNLGKRLIRGGGSFAKTGRSFSRGFEGLRKRGRGI